MESGEILHIAPKPIRVAGPLPKSGELRLNLCVTESSASRWTPEANSKKYALQEWAIAVLSSMRPWPCGNQHRLSSPLHVVIGN